MIKQLHQNIRKNSQQRGAANFKSIAGYLSPKAISYSAKRLPSENPLFAILVWFITTYGNLDLLEEAGFNLDQYPQEFQSAIVRKMFADRGGQQKPTKPPPVETFLSLH